MCHHNLLKDVSIIFFVENIVKRNKLTFLRAIFLMATRSPLKIPMVVNSWVGGSEAQLAIDARPEWALNC
jgi:hypothetical protein